MITHNVRRAIAVATTICLPSVGAFADDLSPASAPAVPAGGSAPALGGIPFTGFIGLGLIGVEGNNPNQAGRYTGLNTTGLDAALSEFNLIGHSPWDSGAVRYYELGGDNLIFHTDTHLGTGLGSDNNWSSRVDNGLANNGSVGFKAGDQGIWGSASTMTPLPIPETSSTRSMLSTAIRNS
jgi:hypothetical protein